MKAEKWQKICLPPQKESTEVKGENAVGDQKDHDKHIGQRRSKITVQLSLKNDAQITPWPAPPIAESRCEIHLQAVLSQRETR